MHYTIDFHTHSIFSPDGGITKKEYEKILAEKRLDAVTITDHHSVEYALYCQRKIGERIIVGEEMTSTAGHVIGLFLTKTIPSGLSLEETIERIHAQEGLVYIPHPFDSARHGIGEENLQTIQGEIDILESFNARIIFRSQNKRAKEFAFAHKIPMGVGSDAHSSSSLGYTFAILPKVPTASSLPKLLEEAVYQTRYLPFLSYFQPKLNRIKKRLYER